MFRWQGGSIAGPRQDGDGERYRYGHIYSDASLGTTGVATLWYKVAGPARGPEQGGARLHNDHGLFSDHFASARAATTYLGTAYVAWGLDECRKRSALEQSKSWWRLILPLNSSVSGQMKCMCWDPPT